MAYSRNELASSSLNLVDYLSGLFNQLYINPEKGPATDAWRYSHEQGHLIYFITFNFPHTSLLLSLF